MSPKFKRGSLDAAFPDLMGISFRCCGGRVKTDMANERHDYAEVTNLSAILDWPPIEPDTLT
jgi:hypothetical protein